MKETQFKKAKNLQDRIHQLNIFKEYLKHFISFSPLDIRVMFSSFGKEIENISTLYSANEVNKNAPLFKDDIECIFKSIDDKLMELEFEFNLL